MTDRPVLRKVPDVELLKTGEWPLSTGTWTFTSEDLAAAVRAAQSPCVGRPVIKLGHDDPRFSGEPAVGFVDNLRLSEDGSTLVGDLCGVPGWLADIMPSAYPRRSIEGQFNYRDQAGTIHDFALTGLALLGVTPPAVGTLSSLRDVAALYQVEASTGPGGPEKGIRTMPEATVRAAASVEDIRRDFYEQGPGKDTFWWIEEMFLEPSEVIAMDDETGDLKKIPFTVAEDESISWGEATDVKREYVAASARQPDATWASRAESADLADPNNPDPTPTDTGEEPMEFNEDQAAKLTEALGLPDTATPDDVITAVEKLAADAEAIETEAKKDKVTSDDIKAAANKRGLDVIDKETFAAMQKQLNELQDDKRHRIVRDAVKAGKFMPSSHDTVVEQMRAGLITEEAIDKMAPIVSVAGSEMGHGRVDENKIPDDVRETDVYKNWKF